MSYIVVENFKFGMDRRRERVAGTPGTLWLGKNVHITRGADVERRKKFTADYHVPGTFGAFALKQQLYVFGSGNHAAAMPIGVRYQRLQAPDSAAMVAVLDAKAFAGSIYVIAEYDSGHVYHFYNGTRLTDWDIIAADSASFDAVAQALVQKIEANDSVTAFSYGHVVTLKAKTAGTPFDVSQSATDGGVDEVLATGTVEITEGSSESATITIKTGSSAPGTNLIFRVRLQGVDLLSSPVDWVTSNTDTAIALQDEINLGTGTHGWIATASGTTVSLGASVSPSPAIFNGVTPVVTVSGDVTTSQEPFADGAITAIRVHGTQILSAQVRWTSSNDVTATAVQDDINGGTGTHGYTATVSDAIVTIIGPVGSGTTLNNLTAIVTVVGNVETEQTKFTGGVTASTDDQEITLATVQANVVAVAEVRASAEIQITDGAAGSGNTIASITIDGVETLSTPVEWSGSNDATAIRLATAISNGYGTHGYLATAAGDTVTIQAAPGTGITPNDFEILATATGSVVVDADAALAGGVTAVEAVAQVVTATLSGTFDLSDVFVLTIDGEDYIVTGQASGMGRSLFVDKKRVWSPVSSLWRYCSLSDATVWDPSNTDDDQDAGFINISDEADGNDNLVVAARYQGLAAIFSQNSVTLFQLDVDPEHNAFSDNLENTGTLAPGSVVRYGNNDVFYLDLTGIRSLRARDSSNAPFVSDVGNAIDTFVQEYVDSLPKQRLRRAVAAIEPRDGRFLLAAGDRIFVLSFFPGAKISAWTYYEPEEFEGEDIQSIVRLDKRLHVRAGDYIYSYGGLDGDTYPEDDEIIAEIELPFLAGKTAGTIKGVKGFDLAATNTWECVVAPDPNHPDATINIGAMSEITFANPESVPVPGQTSMLAPKLTCRKAGRATISMMALHYEAEEAA